MLFEVDPESSTPIYAQIMERIKWGAVTGLLTEGQQLPSHRVLATRLRVNPNTIIKAYKELEHQGFVRTRRGEGTFIAADSEATQREKDQLLRQALTHAADVALALGCSATEAAGMFQEALQQSREQTESEQGGADNGH